MGEELNLRKGHESLGIDSRGPLASIQSLLQKYKARHCPFPSKFVAPVDSSLPAEIEDVPIEQDARVKNRVIMVK